VTRLFRVANGKQIVIIVGRFEHLARFSQLSHENAEFVYEIKH